MSDTYKPTEHDGRRQDGEIDGRTKQGGNTEFAHGKVDPVEAGKQGGSTGGSSSGGSDDSDNSGGSGGKGQFAGGKVDPVEAGKKGGSSSS